MFKPAVCSVVNSCSGSPEVVGLALLLMMVLIVVLTPLLLVLSLTYFVMRRAKPQDVPLSSSHDRRSAPPMPWPTHEPAVLHTLPYSEHRKAA